MDDIYDTAPTFVSAKAADVILSETRTTSVAPDALRAVNILLDEILWLVLSQARSLEGSRLKTGVLKSIPTQLGKDAVLEAEIEIRAYRDKTQGSQRTGRPPDDVLAAFPLQEAYELLRAKCQVISSFGEVDEDIAHEAQLLERYRAASPVPVAQYAADSAPLYVTAVIEHICQHVLANVARVVARDSSRATADLQDLYTSLCEDSLIYPVFKTLKVHNHIVAHLKAPPPTLTRKKSVSFITEAAMASNAAAITNNPGRSVVTPIGRTSISSPKNSREDSGVRRSNSDATILAQGLQSRGAQRRLSETSENHVLQHGRRGSAGGPHQRSNSLLSSNGGHGSSESGFFTKMDMFDELLESGNTMKVSLTPDRMKTFEVSKDKAGRNANAQRSPLSTPPVITTSNLSPSRKFNGRTSNDVDELGSMNPSAVSTSSSSSALNTFGPAVLGSGPVRSNITRGSPQSQLPPVPPLPAAFASPAKGVGFPSRASTLPTLETIPSTNKNKSTTDTARNRESLDLDDIMNGGDPAESDVEGAANASRLSPPEHGRLRPGSTRPVKLSSAARDLVDFLDQGPPHTDFSPATSVNPSPASSKGKGGRFSSMMTRLRGGSSTEKLVRTRSFERENSVGRSSGSSITNLSSSLSSIPVTANPTGAVPGQIPRHRSQHNLSSTAAVAGPRGGVPPSSWASPLPTPPIPPTPPKPGPILPEHSSELNAPKVVSADPMKAAVPVVEPSPLPSPVSLQFGGNRSTADTPGSSLSSPVTTSMRAKIPPIPERLDLSRANNMNGNSLKPELETDASVNSMTARGAPGMPPPRSPLRMKHVDAVRDSIPEAEQSTVPGSRVDREPRTPTSPGVEAQSRIMAIAKSNVANESTESSTSAAREVSSPSPMPSITPSLSNVGSEEFIERATDLRRLLANAKHVEEARLLVEMFLIRSGLPLHAALDPTDNVTAETEDIVGILAPSPRLASEIVTPREKSTVELLLGDVPCATRPDAAEPAATTAKVRL